MAGNEGKAGVAGHRHGSRTRSLTGTFGPIEIAVPRARLTTSEGKTTEWKSQALRAYQRRTLAADALTMTELLLEEVEPDPLYQEDDEDFWQSHQLDYPRNSEVFSGTVDRAREDAANDDEFVGWLAPREREVLLMHEVHGVALQEVAVALGIQPTEAEGLVASARRRVRAADKAAR